MLKINENENKKDIIVLSSLTRDETCKFKLIRYEACNFSRHEGQSELNF